MAKQSYTVFTLALDNARNSEILEVMGRFVYVKEATDGLVNMDFQLNESTTDKINLKKQFGIIAEFRKLYISNTAQVGKTITLFISSSWDELRIFEQAASLAVDLNEPVVEYGSTPTIYNVTCTNVGTEYSQSLGTDCRKFLIKPRTGNLKVCFTNGGSGTLFISVPAGGAYYEDNIKASITLYFQNDTAGAIAEIVKWT